MEAWIFADQMIFMDLWLLLTQKQAFNQIIIANATPYCITRIQHTRIRLEHEALSTINSMIVAVFGHNKHTTS